MTGRMLDDLFRWLGIAMIAIIACFLIIPIIVTVVMAFDARPYLGSLPPPALSTRWFQKFFSDDYFLRGLGTSVELAILAVA
ncbi:MAG: ABC transporter permease, partial [Hyphomicrobiales bacterium]|nr:ABC transporter permease [Hyphomicrobiales bacterium]